MENEKGKVLLSAKELKEILGCNNNTLYELGPTGFPLVSYQKPALCFV